MKIDESNSEKPNNCEDCISREAVLDIVNNPLNIRLDEIIKKLPSVTPKQKMGRWIYQEGYVPYKWKCNQCSAEFKTDFHFCPNCGAKMSNIPTGSESEEEIGPDKKG